MMLSLSLNYDPASVLRDRVKEGIALLRDLDVPHIGLIAQDWETTLEHTGVAIGDGGVFFIPPSYARTLAAEGIMGTTRETDEHKHTYLVSYVADALSLEECAVIMAHEGMEHLGARLMGVREFPFMRRGGRIAHRIAVKYDRLVSQAIADRPHLREEGIERVARAYGLAMPAASMDRSETVLPPPYLGLFEQRIARS